MANKAADITKRILEHRNMILGYILAHTRDRSNAEDIFQDVCVTVCEKYGDFQEGTNFKAWAMQITRYKILSHYQATSGKRQMLELTPELAEKLADDTVQVDEEEVFIEERQALRKCLEKVKGQNRVLVLKRYGEGLSCKVIAASINWTVEAVYVALSRLRSSLEQCIKSKLRVTGDNYGQ